MQLWPLALVASLANASLAPVVGIDAGNEYMKIAAIAPGHNLEMILNTQSKRKTRSVVSFTGAVRTFGENAYAQQTMYPKHVAQFFASEIGQPAQDLERHRLKPNGFDSRYYPYELSVGEPRQGIKQVVDPRDNTSLYAEEILAHFLNHGKDLMKTHLSDLSYMEDSARANDDVEASFTIPVHYTYRQRQMLRQAAKVAGFKTLSFVSEPMGAALNHALDLMDKLESNATVHKLFIDSGSRHLQGCLVKYSFVPASDAVKGGFGKQTSKVKDILMVEELGCAAPGNEDGRYGAHQLDVILADMALHKSQATELEGSPRGLRRLLKDANKAKHTLSTNKEASLSLGEDVRVKVTRDEFESAVEASSWLRGLRELKSELQALSGSGLLSSLLESVELVGGGWRAPKVYSELETLFHPTPLGQKVNGDESMALGAAMMAANYSTTYKFRPLILTQLLREDLKIKIIYESKATGSTEELDVSFEKGTRYGASRKRLLIPSARPIKLTVRDSEEQTLDLALVEGVEVIEKIQEATRARHAKAQELHANLTQEYISNSETDLMPVWNALEKDIPVDETIKVSVTVKLSPLGLVQVDKAVATWEEVVVDEKDERTTTTPAPETDSTTTSSTEATTETGSTETEAGESSTSTTTTTTTTTKKVRKIFTEKLERRSKHLTAQPVDALAKELSKEQLAQMRRPLPMSNRELRDAKSSLKQYVKRDAEVEKLNEARNRLEALIYDERQRLQDDDYVQRVTETDKRTELLEELSQDEEWLYDEGFTANLTVVNKKLKEIESRFSDIHDKALEVKQRQQTVEESMKDVKDMSSKIEKIRDTKPWLQESELDVVKNHLAAFEAWFKETKAKQDKLRDTAESVLTKDKIKTEWTKVTSAYQKLMKIKKPKAAKNGSTSTVNPTNRQEL